MRWLDASMALRPGMTVWPGDPHLMFDPVTRISEGAACNVSRFSCGTHTGTHCDAPWHFEEDGARLHAVAHEVFFGEALVIDVPDVDTITARDLPPDLPPRVLFRTRNSHCAEDAPFNERYVALDETAATCLAESGVRLVGTDGPSIAPFHDTEPVHHILLRHGIFIVENLRLAQAHAGTYPFVVLPLPLHGADGAPCRAFIALP